VEDSKNINYYYRVLHNRDEYSRAVNSIKPDYIIYNYHWDRMPWLTAEDITENKNAKHYFIWHDGSIFSHYDKYLFFGACDTLAIPEEKMVILPRPIRDYGGNYPVNTVPTIGSFGFCSGNKRFPEIVTMVEKEFPEAQINFHITRPYFGDNHGYHLENTLSACRNNNKNPKVKLNMTSDFMDVHDLLTFLAGNDINVFYYTNNMGLGYSAALDYALSVKRPIAVTDSALLKIIATEDTMLGNKNTIKNILDRGIAPLEDFYKKWSTSSFKKEMEELFNDAK